MTLVSGVPSTAPVGFVLDRMLAPASVAVVGATDRPGSYAAEALLNLGDEREPIAPQRSVEMRPVGMREQPVPDLPRKNRDTCN